MSSSEAVQGFGLASRNRRVDAAMRNVANLAQDSSIDLAIRISAAGELTRLSGSELGVQVLRRIAFDFVQDDLARIRANSELIALGEVELGIKGMYVLASDDDVDAGVRVVAAEKLARHGLEHTAISVLMNVIFMPDVDQDIRIDAVRKLAEIEEEEVDSIIAALEVVISNRSIDPECRIAAACALIRLGESAIGIQVLTEISSDWGIDDAMRTKAARELMALE